MTAVTAPDRICSRDECNEDIARWSNFARMARAYGYTSGARQYEQLTRRAVALCAAEHQERAS